MSYWKYMNYLVYSVKYKWNIFIKNAYVSKKIKRQHLYKFLPCSSLQNSKRNNIQYFNFYIQLKISLESKIGEWQGQVCSEYNPNMLIFLADRKLTLSPYSDSTWYPYIIHYTIRFDKKPIDALQDAASFKIIHSHIDNWNSSSYNFSTSNIPLCVSNKFIFKTIKTTPH